MSSPVACTIVANNYLAYARVLAESFLAQHPDGAFHVLIVDRRHPEHDGAGEPFTSWFAEELGIPGFLHLAFRYSILELSTAVKPWFLRHLHQQTGAPAVVYFDPDILVTGKLDELYERLRQADLLMTPHVSTPIDDDRTPGERDFLLSGIYNLGFLGVAMNERTLPFLDWWHRRLYRECLHAVERGLFVDQRWMDFAPAFLDRVAVLREPGWNAAYWNLLHHRLEHREVASNGAPDGEWRIDGRPLRFYHFSGYALERPEQISKYQNRFTLDDRPDLAPLFADYGERLRHARHATQQKIPYAFGAFDNGAPVPELARWLLRDVDPEGKRWPDPFRTGGEDSFYSWISDADDAEAEPFIPRLAVALWEARMDLRQVFPALRGPSRVGFARWLIGHGDHGFGEDLLVRVHASLRPPAGTAAAGIEQAQRRVWHVLARHGAVPHEALSADEVASLAGEASAVDGGRPLFSRLGLILHRMRADLRASYPDPGGAQRVGFALWFVTSGWREYDLPWALVSPVWRSLGWRQRVWAMAWWTRSWWRRRPARRQQARALREHFATALADPPPPPPASLPDGVNVVGWTEAKTGVGEACRGSLAALAAARVPHAVWSLVEPEAADSPIAGADAARRQGAPYEVDLLHVNADMMEVVTNALPHWVTAGRHRIGYWFWELSHFPLCFAPSFERVDEVWAPTKFCLDAFTPLATVPVRWVPPGVPRRAVEPMVRHDWGVPDDCFLFLCTFDARSVPERKNPRGVLAALARAVEEHRSSPKARPLHLLLKVNHGSEAPELIAELKTLAAGLPVTLSTASVQREVVDSLLAGCDALLSLHRSEGLGLPLIEAMQLGRPVIATGYGGCCDFLDDKTGWVVRHKLVPLRQAYGPYPPGAVWAEPEVEHAAELMARVAADREGRARRIETARRRVDEIYAPAAAGERIRRELDRILAARRGQRLLPFPPAAVSASASGANAGANSDAIENVRPLQPVEHR
ncbi:MAG TPA: glycosyltransferase [Thermoanaerobaculia bacterium]|nr:glycosyltransferase [Thermoanaerobaculia bacterium]